MIAIVTDATACFQGAEAVKHNIVVLPMKYTIGDNQFSEKYTNSPHKINSDNVQFCSTAATGVYDYYTAFKKLCEKNMEIICLTISSRFSSAFSNAVTASNMLSDYKIFVVDSKFTGGGLHFMVEEAVKMAQLNMTATKIVKRLMLLQKDIGIAFSVNDISILRKSGRMGVVSESIGTILNIRPILLCKNGTVVSDGIARGRQAQIMRLINKIPTNAKKVIVHGRKNDPLVRLLCREVGKRVANYKVAEIGSILTIHLGVETIGVAWI